MPVSREKRFWVLFLSALVVVIFTFVVFWGRARLLVVGQDGRHSNSKYQVVLWFGVLLITYIATLYLRWAAGGGRLIGGIAIPYNLLLLSGLSALSFAEAKAITASKVSAAAAARAKPQATTSQFPADLLCDDSGRPDLGDFQMLVVTLLALVVYAALVFAFLGTGQPPEFPLQPEFEHFDGMVEIYFDRKEDARLSFSSPPWEALRKQEMNWIDPPGSTGYVFTDEYVTAEGAEWAAIAANSTKPKTKVIRTVKRQTGLTRDQFKDYWLNNHSQLEKTRVVKTLTRRIAATFLTGEVIGGAEPSFDGLASLYYDSIESAKTHFAGGSQSVMRKDEQHFVDLDYTVVRVIAQEYSVR